MQRWRHAAFFLIAERRGYQTKVGVTASAATKERPPRSMSQTSAVVLESRVTLARAEQVKPIPFSIRAHSARASLGLPKLAYLSASSISAAAVAISLPLCNLSKLIGDMTLHAMWIQVDDRLGSRLQRRSRRGYAGERRGPGQVAAYSTVRFRVPRRTRGTPCAAVGRCARACGPGLLDSNTFASGR